MRKMFSTILGAATIAAVLAPAILCAETAAGLRWTAPPGWKSEPPRPMRAATYTVPRVSGDESDGEVVVNYFGEGQGGSVEANIERWKGQVVGSDGKPAAATVVPATEPRARDGL